MKKLKLQAMSLGAMTILSREQLKNVIGGSGSGSSSRCSNDRICSIYQPRDGGCKDVAGQCRCVKYVNGSASESVPSTQCLL